MALVGYLTRTNLCERRDSLFGVHPERILWEHEEVRFFYWNGIPKHWWDAETPVAKAYLEMFHDANPGDILLAAYVHILQHWLEVAYGRSLCRQMPMARTGRRTDNA